MRNSKSFLTNKKSLFTFLIILSLLIISVGYYFYKNRESTILQQKYLELKTIADLKQNQIEQWLHQRNADVKVLRQVPFFIEGISQWLQNTNNLLMKEQIIQQLQPVQKELGYQNIFLTTSNGNLLLSAKPDSADFDSFIKQKIDEASIKNEIVFTDIYLNQKENKILYDIIAPITNNQNKRVAILLF